MSNYYGTLPKSNPRLVTFNDTQLARLAEIIKAFDDVDAVSIYRLPGSPRHLLALEVSDISVVEVFMKIVDQEIEKAPDFVKNFEPGRQRLYVFQALAPDILPWLRDIQPTSMSYAAFCDVLFFPKDWKKYLTQVKELYPVETNGHVLSLVDREPVVTLRF